MDKELAYKKICAFLHDPPDKPIALSFKIAHEDLALDYLSILLGEDIEKITTQIKKADILAAKIDRVDGKEKSTIVSDFFKDTKYLHILKDKDSNREESEYSLLDDKEVSFIRGELQDKYRNFTINNIKSIFEFFKNKYGSDLEKLYFALWRLLFDELSEINELTLIDKFPADTRFPNHNIEDHLNLASAFLREKDKLYFGLLSVGPVQDFISYSRSLKDLWAGSYLIAYLTFNAMLPFVEEYGPDSIIFPNLKNLPIFDKWLKEKKGIDVNYDEDKLKIPSIPNRFLVVCDNSEKMKELFRESENNINQIVSNMKDYLLKEKGIKDNLNFLDNYFELYWVINEFDFETKENIVDKLYKNSFNALEQKIAYRKQIRNFNYYDENTEHKRKCTMCGQKPAIETDINSIILKENEKLCPICLIKRDFMYFLDSEKQINIFYFPSIAGIAAKNFVEKNNSIFVSKIINFRNLLKQKIEKNIDEKKKTAINEKLEVLNFIVDNNIEKCLEGAEAFYPEFYDNIIKELKDTELKNSVNEIKKGNGKIKLTECPKYYAVLMMDGDDMGQWLGGDKVENLTIAMHRIFSRILSNLANFILPDIANKNKAQIIYAGGDDLLAFVPLENLLDFMSELRKKFSELEVVINNKRYMSLGPDVTMSMGIIIAHYNENLKIVLEKVRAAEKIAKDEKKGNKNSFCINLIKNSGDEKMGYLKWKFLEYLKILKKYLIEKKISNNLFYSLDQFTKYVNDEGILEDFYFLDLYRVIKRHITVKNKDEKEEIMNKLKDFFEETKNYDFLNISMLLKIISFIARGE